MLLVGLLLSSNKSAGNSNIYCIAAYNVRILQLFGLKSFFKVATLEICYLVLTSKYETY